MSSGSTSELRITPERYFAMTECGILSPDDRIELLDGLIVSMAAQTAAHAATVHRVEHALQRKLGADAIIRTQATFLAGDASVPEPDVAVVPGTADEYFSHHPSMAHLIVEVAHSSVIQDRITKAAIYAHAGIPCYWIVNVRDHCVEVFGQPERTSARYKTQRRATGRDQLQIDAYPGVPFEAWELLPPRLASGA